MYTCILCRHGELYNPQKIYYGRSFDFPLHEKGKQAVKLLGEAIRRKNISVTVIYTSPLKRAVQTAEILSTKLKVPVAVHNNLIDVDIPALAGKPLTIRNKLFSRNEDEYAGTWVRKGNEPREAIAQRMIKAFHEIMDQCGAGRIPLIVSHGDPLVFLLYTLENPGKRLLPIGELKQLGYGIKKGHGVLVRLNRKRTLLKKEIIL